jgi:adenylate cyclase
VRALQSRTGRDSLRPVGKEQLTARLRLGSGLVLYAYVATHLLNHALGIHSLAAMEAGRMVFLAIWRNPVGTVLLYGAVATHIVLVLFALYNRTTLRMPKAEVLQIVLGLLVPPLVILHVVGTRIVHELFGVDDRYAFVVWSLYQADPAVGWRQAAALVVAWLHGSMGVYFWLRLKPWFPRWQNPLFAVALLLPVTALAGFAQAGNEIGYLLRDPEWLRQMARDARLPGAEAVAQAYRIRDIGNWTLAAILIGTFALRFLRLTIERRRGLVTLTYPGGKKVTITPGITVLEASRLHGIPHASVCGGRGRCSTCRVRVASGADRLPEPSAEETKVLARVGAPEGVRLACQIRPTENLTVAPLLPPGAQPKAGYRRPAYLQGGDREIAVLFADLRAFTKFSETKLPYDVVFVVNEYFRAMGRAVEESGGRLDKFIGDGVMALFGVEDGPVEGCRKALRAAHAMAHALAELNETLRHDLAEPLRIGIGIHVGPVIVGEMGYASVTSVTAIGDTVNTASRLETATKEFQAQLVLSTAVAERAGLDLGRYPRETVEIRGRSEPLPILVVKDAETLGPVLEPAKIPA